MAHRTVGRDLLVRVAARGQEGNLARIIGVTQWAVGKIKSGRTWAPTLPVTIALRKWCGIPVDCWLMPIENMPSEVRQSAADMIAEGLSAWARFRHLERSASKFDQAVALLQRASLALDPAVADTGRRCLAATGCSNDLAHCTENIVDARMLLEDAIQS